MPEITLNYADFKLNTNGFLNKCGENVIFCRHVEVIKFGVGSIINGNLFLQGGFLSLFPGNGFGRVGVLFLFDKLPCINTISLCCKDNVLPFWIKCGGKVIGTGNDFNQVTICRTSILEVNLVIS